LQLVLTTTEEKEKKRNNNQRDLKTTSKYAEHLRTFMASASGTQQERMVRANKAWVEQRQKTKIDSSASSKAGL
jgi:hypothetical protein